MIDDIPMQARVGLHYRGFRCWGHFYLLRHRNRQLECRSRLEIVQDAQRRAVSERLLPSSVPDLVFVLLNPGSCRPQSQNATFSLGCTAQSTSDFGALSPAVPDSTQRQVIDLLRTLQLSHARILNLSDLCEPDSTEFFRRVSELDQCAPPPPHSLFVKSRMVEQARLLNASLGIAVLGWGVHPMAATMATSCLASLRHCELATAGIAHSRVRNGYYHPLPRSHAARLSWRATLASKLADVLENRLHSARMPNHPVGAAGRRTAVRNRPVSIERMLRPRAMA